MVLLAYLVMADFAMLFGDDDEDSNQKVLGVSTDVTCQ